MLGAQCQGRRAQLSTRRAQGLAVRPCLASHLSPAPSITHRGALLGHGDKREASAGRQVHLETIILSRINQTRKLEVALFLLGEKSKSPGSKPVQPTILPPPGPWPPAPIILHSHPCSTL